MPGPIKTPTKRCKECEKPLKQVDANLLKASLRMRCQNEETTSSDTSSKFGYGVSSKMFIRRPFAMTPLIQNTPQRNRALHDCYTRHTNSRKREYTRWDIPSAELLIRTRCVQPARSSLTAMVPAQTDEDERAEKSADSSSFEPQHEGSDNNDGQTTDRTTLDDDTLPEVDRLHLNIERIRQKNSAAMLREIQVIKERHKTLAELTAAGNRTKFDNQRGLGNQQVKFSTRPALDKLLIHQSILEKDAKFHSLIEKTTVKMNRNFRPNGMEESEVGFQYKCPHIPFYPLYNKKAGLKQLLHPVADAIQSTKAKPYVPIKLGDNPPAVYYPPACEAKTPVESALRLHRFVRHLERERDVPIASPNIA